MIKTVTVTNHLGEVLILELRFPEKSGFSIQGSGIDGLGFGKANINSTELATSDGSVFNSARVVSRNIVFELGFLPNPTIEETRHLSYKYFPLKRRVKIEIETDIRTSEIFGYVEQNDPRIFSQNQSSIISIICPDPYFYSSDQQVTQFSGRGPAFEFPFSNDSVSEKLIIMGNLEIINEKTVYYPGDVRVGLTAIIHATGPAENIRIVNSKTRELMDINTGWFYYLTDGVTPHIIAGDVITISTVKGNKFITLQRAGVVYNVLNSLGKNIDWFQLDKGDNFFVFTATDGIENLEIRIENQIAYGGI